MLKLVLALFFAVTAASVAIPTDDECRLTGWVSIAGQVVWGCPPETFCNNSKECTKSQVTVGGLTTVQCHCQEYTPNLQCEGIGYYELQPNGTWVATFECIRNGCPTVCWANEPANPAVVICGC